MPIGFAGCTEYPDVVLIPYVTFGASNKPRASIDSNCAIVVISTLASLVRLVQNELFKIILKVVLDYCHANTSKLFKVMIDATHRLAYPLVKRLGGRASGNIPTEGDDGYGI